MHHTKSFYNFGLSALTFMTVCLHGIAALDSPNGLYAPEPNSVGGLGCGTSGLSDTLQFVANDSLVCFVYNDEITTTIIVSFCCFQGQPGLGTDLTLNEPIGALAQTPKGNMYFLSTAGCPYIVQVFNNNNLVFGYKFFPGYLAFQAFATQKVNCPYNCNTCRTAQVIRVPNELRYFSGGVQFLYRNLRSYSVVPFSTPPLLLQAQLQKSFITGNFQNVNAQAKGQCVIVNDQFVYEQCCTVARNLTDPNAYVFDNGDFGVNYVNTANEANNPLCGQTVAKSYELSKNNNASLYQLYCDYVLKSAEFLDKFAGVGLLLRYKIVFASSFYQAVVVISCYSSFTVFETLTESLRGEC